MTKFDHCPVCLAKDIKEVLIVKDFTVSEKTFPVFHCNICSVRFTQDIPGETEIGAYYQSSNYISHTDTREGLINKLYHLVRNITLKNKRKLVEQLSRGAKGIILDYGCGTGAFLQEMQQAGWKVTGLEPDIMARESAQKLNGSTVFSADYISSIPDQQFDCISLWHVLEHVHRLHPTLKQLNRVMKPGAGILIAVPNYTSNDAMTYGPAWAAWDVPRHLYHFSPESIKKLLAAHGFKLTAIHPMWFDSFYVSMLSEKYLRGKNNHLRAFFIGLRSNIKALMNKERCSSLIYVAVKE
jgi:2-polyprenyl-3-methyl-5-hydroxy-6-metoxy-1,4-benzoquinol methylase